jgi:hypothetical protein
MNASTGVRSQVRSAASANLGSLEIARGRKDQCFCSDEMPDDWVTLG